MEPPQALLLGLEWFRTGLFCFCRVWSDMCPPGWPSGKTLPCIVIVPIGGLEGTLGTEGSLRVPWSSTQPCMGFFGSRSATLRAGDVSSATEHIAEVNYTTGNSFWTQVECLEASRATSDGLPGRVTKYVHPFFSLKKNTPISITFKRSHMQF